MHRLDGVSCLLVLISNMNSKTSVLLKPLGHCSNVNLDTQIATDFQKDGAESADTVLPPTCGILRA